MAVSSYNKYLRQLLGKCECILAFDTAADYLGLTNGGQRAVAQIYVKKKQDVEETEQTCFNLLIKSNMRCAAVCYVPL